MNVICFFILYLLPDLQAAVILQNISTEAYQWKTGLWSACDRRTKCGEGHKVRRMWCINSSGYIVHNSNCNSSTRPSTTKQCFTVCDHHKYVLRWRIGEWSPCIAETTIPCSGDSVVGVSHRSVECILSSTNLVVDDEACEYFWHKPDSEMACSLDCPQECLTVKKNVTCQVQECSEQISWMEEVDEVIVAPSNEDSGCNSFNQQPVCRKHHFTEKCKSFGEDKQKYRLKISSWGPCISGFNLSDEGIQEIQYPSLPVVGISERKISCIDDEGFEVDLSFCNTDSMETVPPLIRKCVVSSDCIVSPWSEWYVQHEGCVSSDGRVHPETRTRQRRLLQLPIGMEAKPCPPLFEERIVETGLPRCDKYQWYPLEWTDCQIVLHDNHGDFKILKPTCGKGLQYRNLTCLRSRDRVLVDREFCKDTPPPTVQRCTFPCKRDCQVSHWSRWGPCMPYNSSNLKELGDSGYRRRVRTVIAGSSNGGKECPHLEEVDECFEINIFNWQYGNWSECVILDPQSTCGRGKRTRDFTCVKYNGVPMNNLFCDYHYPLMDTTDTCRVPCPNDCIMSEWSEWSDCSQTCYTKKEKGFYFRTRTVLAVAGEGGKPCKSEREQRKKCNLYSCNVYKWTTSDWEACEPLATNEVSISSCGTGIQKREVICTKGSSPAKLEKMCRFMEKPESTRRCHLPCPENCVVSNFTDWTSCDHSCDSDAVQYRHLVILQSSKYNGKPCPEALVEARPCSSSFDNHCIGSNRRNLTYQWNTSSWSDCMLPLKNQACGMGFQIRNVTCFDSAGRAVEPHLCLPSNWTLPDGPILDVPSSLRSCEVVCSSNCVVSTWSAWSRCIYEYDAKRYRRRELVGKSKVNEYCLQKINLLEEESCSMIPANLTDSAENHWMSCIVEDENRTVVAVNNQRILHACGGGYRYKSGLHMKSVKGIEPGLDSDFCWVDCPVDCLMSDWSDWTECNVPCGQGFRERRRHIIVEGNELGRPCPRTDNKTEIQRDVCNIVCMDYHWLAGGWTDCELDDPDSACGMGTHYRTVRCFDKRTGKETEESRCDPLSKPRSMESCRVYCPGECVVSPWNVSKKCTEPCSDENFQELQRVILRLPNSTAEPCPPLITMEPCIINSTCHHHDWVLGPWGSCVLPEGAYCGEGVQKRPLICLRSDGRQVDPIQCEKIHKSFSLKEPLSKPCYTDCPVDCIMSEWSAWNTNACSACGPTGVMTRRREILQTPSEAGQPCFAEMEQQKPCDFKPCYHWKQSEWSPCDLEGAGCGYGVRRRVVECIRFDHLKVDKSHCLVVNVTFTARNWIDPAWLALAQEDSREEELCHVPCPGDDIMSEWSNWNHCQKNCGIGQTVGYQTSSRHILFHGSQQSFSGPLQLWRTKPCWSDNCDMFAWKLRNDSYICERKDGLVIQGGCTSKPRPCFSECQDLGGTCESATGICYCEDGQGYRTVLGNTSKRCKVAYSRGPKPANHSAPTPEIRLKYYPDDSQVSFWMYAMISIGTAFVIFVAVTVYLMCRSSLRQRTVSVERQPSVRRRLNGAASDKSNLESNIVRSHSSHK